MRCDYCHKESVVLRRVISASGVNMFAWYCPDHDSHAKRDHKWIKHKTVKSWQDSGRLKVDSLDDIPVWIDHSKEVPGCCICGQPAELHHWAPQSLAHFFGDDWFKYPLAPLCKEHHDKWHNIVTWYLPGRTDTELAAEVKARYFGQEPGRPAVGLEYVKARVQAQMGVLEAQP